MNLTAKVAAEFFGVREDQIVERELRFVFVPAKAVSQIDGFPPGTLRYLGSDKNDSDTEVEAVIVESES